MTGYDSIVIGGGIAGLLTALRLSRGGHSVALLEADRLGGGATSANHGMVHSGALYVRQHGHVVDHCQQAQPAFSALVPDAELAGAGTVYVVRTGDVDDFRIRLDHHRVAHDNLEFDDVPELEPSLRETHRLLNIGERVFSSRQVVEILAGQCLAAGVTVLTGSQVMGISHLAGSVTGVRLASEELHARHVIVATGIGTAQLLSDLGSRVASELSSRLDMMIHLPATRLRRGLVFPALDSPVVMPTASAGALTSFFGGMQPTIIGRRTYPVDIEKATALLRETTRVLSPSIAAAEGAVAYVAGKTDFVGSPYAEKGKVNPGFHIIDHEAVDGLRGLYTIITGKMTLAFHVSRAVANAILDADLPLVIPPGASTTPPAGSLAVEPWAAVGGAGEEI